MTANMNLLVKYGNLVIGTETGNEKEKFRSELNG